MRPFANLALACKGFVLRALRLKAWLVAASACLILASPLGMAANVDYVYDELGRLVQVVAPSGDVVRYTYDAAGNIKAIERFAPGVLSLSEFTPNSGPAGTSVTIYGSGFSTTLASNTVKFNGVAATVTAATATRMTVTVPATATSGPIQVTVGSSTATTSQSFTVGSATGQTPTITGFTPDNGPSGTVVTITGTNFDSDKANDLVRLSGKAVPVTTASATQLQVTIPPEALSGKFSVTTLSGSALSTADFFVPPSGISAASIAIRGRIVVDGASVNASGLPASQYAQYLFDASAGQTLGLGVTGISGTFGNVSLRAPDGSSIVLPYCASFTPPGGGCNFPKLPKTGTYQLLVQNNSASGTSSFTLTLSSDVPGVLAANAASPTTMSIPRAGQNGRYTFSGTAGQNVSLVVSGATIPGTYTYIYVYAPDGTQLGTTATSSGTPATVLDVSNLPVTGTYTVFVDPYLANTGQLNLALRTDQLGTLAVDGANTVVALMDGQNGRYTFSGTAGQRLGLGISALSTSPAGGSVMVTINGPTGAQTINCYPYGYTTNGNCNLPALPATGTYTVLVNPQSSNSANLTLTLSNSLTGTLTINAATPTTFSTTRPGQDGLYTFSGTAGQGISLVVSGTTIAGSNTYIYLYAPDGTQLGSVLPTYSGAPAQVLDVTNLPSTGTYTVFVDPYQANTGQLNLALRSEQTGTLTIDGTSTAIALLDGQNGRYTFNGTTGQRLGLGIGALSTSPAGGGVVISVNGPTGAVLINCNPYGYTSNANCNLPTLPATGTYTVLINPQSNYSANVTLTLSNSLTGTLTVNAVTPTTFNTTRPGQDGLYTFSGTAGQNVSVVVSGTTIAGSYTYVYLYAPDGTQRGSALTYSGAATAVLDANNLPSTGTYTVFVDPYQANTGQLNLALRSEQTGSLTIDGTSTAVALLDGQNGRYTFSGTAGQRLGLGISAFSTSPAGGTVNIAVNGPTGILLINCPSLSANGNCNLPILPATGTYTVLVNPQSSNSANLTLTLSNSLTGTLTANAATPTTFNTTRPGQDGLYTFSGTAGQNVSLVVSGTTIVGSNTYLYVYAPDGTQVGSVATFSGGPTAVLDINYLPSTGTYTVFIDPYQANTGQLNLVLRSELTGTLAIDGTSTAVALQDGQNGRYTFSGTVGQRLGLGISALSTSPAAGNVAISVNNPIGAQLFSCPTYSVDGNCNLPILPATGTYTVLVNPLGSNTANLTLTLSSDITGSLTVNAASPTTFNTTRSGQDGRYTFSGTAGQNYSVAISSVTIPGNYSAVRAYAPDGTVLTQVSAASGYTSPAMVLNDVPATGTYTLHVDPYGASTGALSLLVTNTGSTAPGSQMPNGSITVDGSALALSIPANQTYLYTFSGTAGQYLGLGLSGLTTSPANNVVSVVIRRTNNTSVLYSCGSMGPAGSCNFPALPATGTYTIAIQTSSAAVTGGSLLLSSDFAGSATINAAATTFSTTRAGQNGRYTFVGTAGQRLTLVWTGGTFAGASNFFNVYQPDGTLLNTTSFSSTNSSYDLYTLPATGNYTLQIDPYQANTGQVSFVLQDTAAGTLTVDGTPLAVTLASGQNGRYTFSGTAGQNLGLALSPLSTTPSGAYVYTTVYTPSGAELTNCSGNSTAYACNLKALPQTGTYVVNVDTSGSNSTSLSLTLSSDLTGSITPNGAAVVFNTTRAGQNGRYTFSGTVGQRLVLAWSGSTLTSGAVTIYRPDGSILGSSSFSSTTGNYDLDALNATGTYTLFVDPTQVSTGQISFSLLDTASNGLTVDGSTLAISLAAGQNGRYSFSGTAGQTLGLGLSSMVTTPASGYVAARVYDPNGAMLTDCSSAPSNYSCSLKPLTQTGTYNVEIDPAGYYALTANLTLSSDITGALTPNGAAAVFTTSRPGQYGRYTFTGTAGQRLTLKLAGITITNGVSLYIYRPDGSLMNSNSTNADSSWDLEVLWASGTYTVVIDPYQTNTGQASLSLVETAAGALTVDGSTIAVSLSSGQNGRYTFAGTAGQSLGLGISSPVTSPAGNSIAAKVYDPNGILLNDCGYSSVAYSCALKTLPQTGSYVLELDPSGVASASFNLTLSSDVAGLITPNTGATVFSTTRPGQNARYTFNGTAGQRVALVWRNHTFTGNSNYIYFVRPDGAQLASFGFGAGAADGNYDFGVLPATGTYLLKLDPSATDTGTVDIHLSDALSLALSVDAAPTSVSLGYGRIVQSSFAGVAGQNLGAILTNVTTSPAAASTNPLTLKLFNPVGQLLQTCALIGSLANNSCKFPTLQESGNFKLEISPASNQGSFDVQIKSTI